MEKLELIYHGNAKKVFKSMNEDELIIEYTDEVSAFNGVKRANIENKGIISSEISNIIFEYLKNNGIKTHYIKKIDNRNVLVKKVDIIRLEFIVRNIVAGNMANIICIEEGSVLKEPILEINYKNDSLGDPLINDNYALALELINKKELEYAYNQVSNINKLLTRLFKKINLILVDFKVELGFDKDGVIILADEFSPDNARLWDTKTKCKYDKDVFRRDLGDIYTAYLEVLNRLKTLDI